MLLCCSGANTCPECQLHTAAGNMFAWWRTTAVLHGSLACCLDLILMPWLFGLWTEWFPTSISFSLSVLFLVNVYLTYSQYHHADLLFCHYFCVWIFQLTESVCVCVCVTDPKANKYERWVHSEDHHKLCLWTCRSSTESCVPVPGFQWNRHAELSQVL